MGTSVEQNNLSLSPIESLTTSLPPRSSLPRLSVHLDETVSSSLSGQMPNISLSVTYSPTSLPSHQSITFQSIDLTEFSTDPSLRQSCPVGQLPLKAFRDGKRIAFKHVVRQSITIGWERFQMTFNQEEELDEFAKLIRPVCQVSQAKPGADQTSPTAHKRKGNHDSSSSHNKPNKKVKTSALYKAHSSPPLKAPRPILPLPPFTDPLPSIDSFNYTPQPSFSSLSFPNNVAPSSQTDFYNTLGMDLSNPTSLAAFSQPSSSNSFVPWPQAYQGQAQASQAQPQPDYFLPQQQQPILPPPSQYNQSPSQVFQQPIATSSQNATFAAGENATVANNRFSLFNPLTSSAASHSAATAAAATQVQLSPPSTPSLATLGELVQLSNDELSIELKRILNEPEFMRLSKKVHKVLVGLVGEGEDSGDDEDDEE